MAQDVGSVQNLRDAYDYGAEDGAVSTVGGNVATRTDAQIQGGVCTPGDDWVNQTQTPVGTATGSGVAGRPTIPAEFTQKIIPKPNRLSNMASQTYSISLYLLKPDDYTALVASGKKQLPAGSKIIIQSGGIQGSSAVGTRNQYFDVDFYIDEVVLKGNVPSKGTGGPNQSFSFTMTILETNGITLLQRLNAAIRAENGSTGNIGINSAFYLMVIRFYGYDDNGNLISGTQAGYSEPGSDSASLVEKFFPFTINNITYQISSKLVEYNVECVIPNMSMAFGTNVGTIPFPIELSAPDIRTLFGGPVGAATTSIASTFNSITNSISGTRNAAKNALNAAASGNPADVASYAKATLSTATAAVGSITGALNGLTAPAKASAISSTDTTSIKGLTQALNDWQQQLVKDKSQDYADIYSIELANTPGLADAKLAKQGDQDKARAPMNESSDPSKKQLDSKNNYNKDTKTWSIDPGTQVVQFIDMVMRNSTYITSQQNIVFPETGGPPKPQTPSQVVQWYYVNAKIIPYAFDKKRNCYAVKVTYSISPYLVYDTRNPYFAPSNKYRGAHKSYSWWFTGLNTEVLEWNIEVKNNYVTTFGNNTNTSAVPLASQPALGINEKRTFATRPNETSQGGKLESTMPAASLASRLYADTDLTETEITILGDPDWIIQTGMFYQEVNLSAWAPDDSVNTTSSPVFFEVLWNAPTDYDLLMGIEPVNTGQGVTNQRALFNATLVTSTFKDGKFTQKVKGVWVNPDQGNNVNNSANSGTQTSNDATQVEGSMSENQAAAQDTQTKEETASDETSSTSQSNTDTRANPEYDPTNVDDQTNRIIQIAQEQQNPTIPTSSNDSYQAGIDRVKAAYAESNQNRSKEA